MKIITIVFIVATILGTTAVSRAAESKTKPQAAKSAKKAKSRTLKELIAYAEKYGSDKKLGQVESDDLGFPGRFMTKNLLYVLTKKPHIHSRLLLIVYDETSTPISLIWRDFKRDINGEIVSDERWDFKSSLTGQLQGCTHGTGNADTASQTVVEIDEQIKKSFNVLVSFFLIDAMKLEPKTKK